MKQTIKRAGKRICSSLLVIALMLSTVFCETQTKAEETEEYIEITNVSELYAIRNNLSGKYRLMNDIDLTQVTAPGGDLDGGNGWVPIDGFSGTLDGNGYYIKGLTMYGEISDQYVGLFGNADNCNVCNLGLVDVNIDISMTRSSGDWDSDWYFGGIVGYDGYTISSCLVTGNITIRSASSNGPVGGLSGDHTSIIMNCYNAADINVYKGDGYTYRNNQVGGIAGHVYDHRVCKYNYNIGTVNSGNGEAIEGNFWNDYGFGQNYYLNGTGKGTNAIPFSETQMKNSNYYTNWDFTDIWEIDDYANYSYPQLRSCPQTRVKSIEVVTPPSKLEYNQGEEIDFSDATVKVVYENGYSTTIFLTEDLIEDTYDTSVVGKQNVTVSKGQASIPIEIQVNAIPVQQINLDSTSISIHKGYSQQLSATVLPETATYKSVSWSSADESIATVDQNGKVLGVGKGTTQITATSQDGVKATCDVTVSIPCVMLLCDNYDVTINKGDSYKQNYKISPLDSTDHVVWKSSDEEVVRIDNEGNWVGVSGGMATVTGTADSGTTAICTVTVLQDLSEFTVIGIKDEIYTGKAITQKPTVTNGSKTLRAGVDYSISYASNIEVGTASITITGKKPYTGSITKTFNITSTQNGTTSKVKLSKGQITSIKASKKKLTISWKRVENAVGYQLQVAKNRKFTKGRKNYYLNSATLKKVFKGSRKTNYYVRVRAYAYDTEGQTFNGSYSSVKKKKTK